MCIIYAGRGIGNVLSRIFGRLIPFLKTAGTKVMKSATSAKAKNIAKKALKSAGKNALKAAGNAALNAIEGKPIKKGVKKDLASARKDIAQTLRAASRELPSDKRRREKEEREGRARGVTKGTSASSIAKRKKIAKTILD